MISCPWCRLGGVSENRICNLPGEAARRPGGPNSIAPSVFKQFEPSACGCGSPPPPTPFCSAIQAPEVAVHSGTRGELFQLSCGAIGNSSARLERCSGPSAGAALRGRCSIERATMKAGGLSSTLIAMCAAAAFVMAHADAQPWRCVPTLPVMVHAGAGADCFQCLVPARDTTGGLSLE